MSLPNLLSALHPLATCLLTTAIDALLHHLLLPLLITLLFSIYICTTPLLLYTACKIVQHFRTLKAENAALKSQLHASQRQREVLRQAQTQVVEERERLEEVFQGFGEIFGEFREAVRELAAEEGSSVDMMDVPGFGEIVDMMAEEIDVGESAVIIEMEEEVGSGGAARKRKFSVAFPWADQVVFEEEERDGMRRLSDASRKWFEDHELDLELLRRE